MQDEVSTRNYSNLIIFLSLFINIVVVLLLLISPPEFLKRYDFSFLPKLNAVFNSLTFVTLLAALYAIKRKNIKLHKRLVLVALSWTTLFLISYIIYHLSTESARFGGTNAMIKGIYYFILITHVILAAVIVPLVLVTLARGLNMQVPKHKKIARWTMPLWLYVSLTGVLVYLFMAPYY